MKKRLTILLFFVLGSTMVFSQSHIKGKVTDNSTGEPIMFANISVTQNGVFVIGVQSDLDGNYTITVEAGTYDVEASYIGYSTEKISGVTVISGKDTELNISMNAGILLSEVVVEWEKPLIEKDHTTAGRIVTSSDIRNLPTQNINAISTTVAGVSTSIRGSRSQGTDSYIDGVRVSGNMIRASETGTTPIEEPGTERYATIVENDFEESKNQPVSTFSIDVDAASYSNMRRFITYGRNPPPDAIRIEEMVNYFEYDYPQPKGDYPFEIITELSTCPWQTEHQLLHIGLQGEKIATENLPASNLVFLIDVSGSMRQDNKLPLLKESYKLLVDNLREKDKVAIVVYAGSSGLVLPSTSGSDKQKIKGAIEKLHSGGSTAGAAGIRLAYQIAMENFIEDGNNRVVLATDGDFNVGVSSDEELVKLIEKKRESGVFLSILGFGTGNYQGGKMQQLADKGNGNHYYIDNLREAKKVLIKEFGGTLFTIAKDVKIQIEFNPAAVKSYRLIGYENRLLNKEDFDDDKKDAGELGAGHTVTALYEIIPADSQGELLSEVGEEGYEKMKNLEKTISNKAVGVIKFRYKKPSGTRSSLIERSITSGNNDIRKTSDNFRWSAAVAEFGLLLRNSKFKSNSSYEAVIKMAEKAMGKDANGYRAEFIELVKQAVRNNTEG